MIFVISKDQDNRFEQNTRVDLEKLYNFTTSNNYISHCLRGEEIEIQHSSYIANNNNQPKWENQLIEKDCKVS